MDIQPTAIPEVKVITPARFGDHRGFFCEVYNRCALAEAGIDVAFVQDNHSYSAERGTLRGLHFQRPPAAQTKLLRVLRGAVIDVAVDCRLGSPTFGRHVMVELSAAAGNQVLCPKGFAHATLTMAPDTEITYKVDAYYAPQRDLGIRFDDPDLDIPWPIPSDLLVLSDKDRRLPWFRDLPAVFTWP
ncbi:MAG TPA: dTDP-4-dehydrorhamnose 3,5-epimerase [Geminicoccaceae bacterium]|nr:dTDP-4-dehydrorhamnose 3,5-epimerase [Geminicoccaceae bacterium]